MSLTDDEVDAEKRRPRPSLDAQRYNFTPKMSPITSPTTASANSTTFLLPILLPAPAVPQAHACTQPFLLKELSGKADGRPSSSATPYIPQEIANANLAIAADRTFLETSSALAARELKKYYEKMGGESYRKGRKLRTPYLITSLEVNGELRFRVSLRTDSEQFQESSTIPSGRPPSLIPAIGGLISSVMAGGGRNSVPSGPRHTLRRPRSISEPRESNFYASIPATGIVGGVGGFVDPFTSSRRSLDYRSPSIDGDTVAPGSSDPYIHRRPEMDNSPFGAGVIYTVPAVPSSPEMPTFLTNPSLREMQSFESNLTARQDPVPSAKFYATSQMLMKKDSILNAASRETTPFSTIVFDILQTFRGAPLPDRLSGSSSEPTVKLSSTSSAVPRDDPRFVIWGEVYSNPFEEQATSQGSHTDLSTSSHSGVSPRRKTSRARSGDVPVIFNSAAPEKLIVAATIERWIAQLTSETESLELVHFFITYRIYISGVDLCHLLICRFHWALEKPVSEQDEVIRAQVRARTWKMIRYWLSHWFKVDFSTNPQLCQVLINWVNTLRKDPAIAKMPDALGLVRRIKGLIRDCKQEAEIGKELENAGKDLRSRPSSSAPISQSDPDLIAGRKSDSVFKTSSESSRSPLSSLDVTTNAMVPVSMGSLDLPPALSILPPQRTSLSPASATMGMLQQPLHMAIWAQTNTSVQAPPHMVSIPGGLPTQHGSLSRALVNTMGKLGRWKRVLNSRSAPVQSQLDCSGISSFDIEQGYAGDLQIFRQSYGDIGPHLLGSIGMPYIPNDLTPPKDAVQESDAKQLSGLLFTSDETAESDADTRTRQPSILLPRKDALSPPPPTDEAEHVPTAASVTEEASITETFYELRPSISDEASSEVTAQPVDATTLNESTINGDSPQSSSRHFSSSSTGTHPMSEHVEGGIVDETTNQISTPQREYSPPSTGRLYGQTVGIDTNHARQSIASSEGGGDANSFFNSSEEDYGEPISSDAAWFPTRPLNSNDFVDMDEYLSSDEEQPSDAVGQLRKTTRRLPHQRDLKFVSRIDSLSSRESPAAAASVHSSVTVEEEEEEESSVGHANDPNSQKVFAWQLEYIDSEEEDEPRDVEAALRRLEGHVDRDRQHKKETKIDCWLRQVKQRKALQFTRKDSAADDDAGEVQSSKDGMESDDVLETPPDDSRDMYGAQIEEHPLTLLPNERQSQHEMDHVHPHLGRESIATSVDQHQSQPFPSVEPSAMRGGSEDTGPVEWPPESTMTHRAHKISQSLSHRASFVKVSGARVLQTSPMHESFVLVNRSLKIAQHLTAIESDIWRHIPIEDLLGIPPSVLDPSPPDDILDWGEYLKQRTGSKGGNVTLSGRSMNGLVMARDRFWITAMWAASEILLTRPNLRLMLVSKFIRVALKCYTLNNFSSLVAIIIGLSLPAVERAIKKMPKSIGIYELRIFESLKSFSSDDGNYRLIRETLSALIAAHKTQSPMEASSTATSADVSRACIPPIGIYLRQLTKLDRLPDYVDPTAPTEPVEDDPHGGLSQPRHPEVFANLAPLPAEMTLEPLINVHKQRLISGVVLSFVNCQQLTGKYKFPMDRKLHQRCLRLRALTMETLEDFSNWE